MSIPVELPALAEVVARYPFAYLMTNSARGAPHAVAVVLRLNDGLLVIDGIDRRTRENLVAQSDVALVWPPTSLAEYSLIIDGRAALDENRLWIAPSRAALHRPAGHSAAAEPGACGSDCVELPMPDGTSGSAAP